MKQTIKTNDLLLLFIAFDTISNNKNIAPEMLKPLSDSYDNIRNHLENAGLINVKAKVEEDEDLTIVE